MLRYGRPYHSYTYRWCFTRKFPSKNQQCLLATWNILGSMVLPAFREGGSLQTVTLFSVSKMQRKGTAAYCKKPQCTQVINYFPSDFSDVQEKNPQLPSCSNAGKQKWVNAWDGANIFPTSDQEQVSLDSSTWFQEGEKKDPWKARFTG